MKALRPNCFPVPKYTPFSPRGASLPCSTRSLPRYTTIPHPKGRKKDMSGCFPVLLKCGESPFRLACGHELYMSVTKMTAAPQNACGIPLCKRAARSPRPSVSPNFSTIPFAACPCSLLCLNSTTPCSFSSCTNSGVLYSFAQSDMTHFAFFPNRGSTVLNTSTISSLVSCSTV